MKPRPPEPVGEVFTLEALGTPGKPFSHVLLNRTLPTGTKLYTATPAPAKPMTDEDLRNALRTCDPVTIGVLRPLWQYVRQFGRAIEAHHGITADSGEVHPAPQPKEGGE